MNRPDKSSINIKLYIRFSTQYGESLFVSGNINALGNNNPVHKLKMQYFDDTFWFCSLDIEALPAEGLQYKYSWKNTGGEMVEEFEKHRLINLSQKSIIVIDRWNAANDYRNTLYTAPFKKLLEDPKLQKTTEVGAKEATHIFKVKHPGLLPHQALHIMGNMPELGSWNIKLAPQLVKEGDWWVYRTSLGYDKKYINYKYCIADASTQELIEIEPNTPRLLPSFIAANSAVLLHDGFINIAQQKWRGAGIAIPVFSLRTHNGLGIGEFLDIKQLVDWCKSTGIKLIQLLPINDTISTNSFRDSYPYATISSFALHPIYINLDALLLNDDAALLNDIAAERESLSALPVLDYEKVIKLKMQWLNKIFLLKGEVVLASEGFKDYYNSNEKWLLPYAMFSTLRDKHQTVDYAIWQVAYNEQETKLLFRKDDEDSKKLWFYCFVQYLLHDQFLQAVSYANKNGVVLKGDLPIGVSRYGCDTWLSPALFNLSQQAGAPPDDFAVLGQNWGFPTYNWDKMQGDSYAWWQQRFLHMSQYFDAFRIDHILGFFRIWSIPAHAVQGILGVFSPCIPVHYVEFVENKILFDAHRFCTPFISSDVLNELFAEHAAEVADQFLMPNNTTGFDFIADYNTQQKIEQHFEALPPSEKNTTIKKGLLSLIANVILYKVPGSNGQLYHFRIDMDKTSSFKNLIPYIQEKIQRLYINYFYVRQDAFWRGEGLKKLPLVKNATDMLVCGEDLGMVPDCVPDVMEQLGILSLEIQRMPKRLGLQFSNPADAPYLSVVTPSTHDMSTIRGWWEENYKTTNDFYKSMLWQRGDAPTECSPVINRRIVEQHLNSPAMWSVFQIQDLLGMSNELRRVNPEEERINVPENPKNYWQYRMHIYLEDLKKEKNFSDQITEMIAISGR